MRDWVEVLKSALRNIKLLKIFAFANNHYGGHAPDTVRQFQRLYGEKKPG
jgi:hypothetical protein